MHRNLPTKVESTYRVSDLDRAHIAPSYTTNFGMQGSLGDVAISGVTPTNSRSVYSALLDYHAAGIADVPGTSATAAHARGVGFDTSLTVTVFGGTAHTRMLWLDLHNPGWIYGVCVRSLGGLALAGRVPYDQNACIPLDRVTPRTT